MATPSAGFAVPLAEFAAALLSESELAPRARLTAQFIAQVVPDAAVCVYVVEGEESPVFKFSGSEGEIIVEAENVPVDSCTLGVMAEKREVMAFAAGELAREDYGHLNIKRTFRAIVTMPIEIEETLIGAVEMVCFDKPPSEALLEAVAGLVEVASIGLAMAIAGDRERNASLESISRLTELYDLELVFSSTLEMEELMPLITSKIKDLCAVQALNLWLVADDEKVVLMNRAGIDPTCEEGTELGAGEGVVADVSESGEVLLVSDPDDERLKARNGEVTAEQGAVFSLVAVPLIYEGKEVGVLEAVNPLSGRAFDEDDLFLLETVSRAATTALHNASLLTAERKVEILETLVEVSTEIVSTLDLSRVLKAIVNGPQAVIPYERASIVLEHHGKLELKAVSGMDELNLADPDVKRLREMLDYVATLPGETFVNQEGDSRDAIDSEDTDVRERFGEYFERTNARSFYALPLADDQGRVGILCMESSETGFLDAARLEIVKVLAAQATVALRNASLYREVPLIGVLEPLLKKREQFFRMEKRRRISYVVLAVAVAAFLAFFPLPMRLDGDATVGPARTAQIQPEIEGVVKNVLVREGDPVSRGTILAEMEDWDYRSALASARAKQASAIAQMNQALASNDAATAGARQIDADLWTAEVQRAQQRLERTKLRSPIDGVVTTPHIENFSGKHLEAGDTFAEVADTGKALVDVEIDEHDMPLLQPGSATSVKLESFRNVMRGEVVTVSPKVIAGAEQRFAVARVEVANPDGLLRPGMQGRGKVSAGWHRAGYVLFRRPGMWFWSKLWNWFGW